ncbi:MAG: zinc ribbon domain-containing protein [Gammaproteobacteria bacterium]|nr:zinc ribbon domain-containing protein [Gammaproteobacteria bacterium]
MAIIKCPACSKRISSVADTCQYCNTVFSNDKDDEAILRSAKNARLLKKQRLQNFSFLFIVLFTAGALVMYFGLSDGDESMKTGGRVMIALGFVGYVTLRIALMFKK